MKKLSILALLLTVSVQWALAHANANSSPLPGPMKFAPLAETFTVSQFFDISLLVYIPCANEEVLLEGQLHDFFTYTINNNRVTMKYLDNPQGITGTSSVSGNKYQATGGTQGTTSGSLVNGQYSTTFENNFRIIGQKTGNNFLVHETTHITINADGTLTAYVDNFSVDCK